MDALIKNDIENDFYECLGEFENLCILLNNISNLEIKIDDLEERKKIKQGQINGILIQLGRIGELAFKYLLKVKQIELYPGQDYKQFSDTERIYKVGQIRNLAKKGLINEKDAEEILSFEDDNNQKFHNFIYMGLIVQKLMPDTYSNFEKCMEYAFQSAVILNELKKLDKQSFLNELTYGYYQEHLVFPCLIWLGNIEVDDERLKKIISKIKLTANNSGDVFTRLRYYSNNKGEKKYTISEVEEIFVYIKTLITFVTGIHAFNNDLLANPESIHGRSQALNYPLLVKRSKEEINIIFDKYGKEETILLSQKLFSGYKVEEIDKIENLSKQYGIDSFMVYEYGILVDELILFCEIGCNNPFIMHNFIFDDSGNRRTIEQIKEIINKEYNFSQGSTGTVKK